MNEVAGTIIIAYFQEIPQNNEEAKLFLSEDNAEADIFTIFDKLMSECKHMEMFRPNYTGFGKIKLKLYF